MSPLWIVFTLLPLFGSAERFNCRGRILGAYYADAKSGCKAFHVCVRVAGGGIRDFRFFCPPGTLFHQEAQTCTDGGDDDPLACPADLYDGQFDLYRIGSGFETKKASSTDNRDEEPEFSLQRAETGDRRLSENIALSNGATSDLKTAHSSDFFSGQRDRGRDDSAPQVSQPVSTPQRQSFRRTPTRTHRPTTQYSQNTSPSPLPTKNTNPLQYDATSKRKLIRKRPVYSTTLSPPSTHAPSQPPAQLLQNYDRRPPNKQSSSTPGSIPQIFKDDYVEVSRVTPKVNKLESNIAISNSFLPSTPFPKFDKNGLVELYNFDAQSTPQTKENPSFKVRNSFRVLPDFPKELDNSRANFNVGRSTTATVLDKNGSLNFDTSTPIYKNINSVSYESEKNNYVSFSGSKQKYYNPASSSTTTVRTESIQLNLNTVAYNTNNGINAKSLNNLGSEEDDGQYRPPPNEDDGQYRPELYERELLTGAHSLNIAASGNRLPEDQKPREKTQPPRKSYSSAPRPFKLVPTTVTPKQTPKVYETIPTTTFSPKTPVTQRTFDYIQTYTTTSRPINSPAPFFQAQNLDVENKSPVRHSTSAPRTPDTHPTTLTPVVPTVIPKKPTTTRAPQIAHSNSKKEDASYDYAYYDTDSGFSEYDNIEEFGKTKRKA